MQFLYKIINHMIDCPELLQNIIFKINRRNANLFYIKYISTHYILNSPPSILMYVENSVNNLEYLNISLSAFITHVSNYNFIIIIFLVLILFLYAYTYFYYFYPHLVIIL